MRHVRFNIPCQDAPAGTDEGLPSEGVTGKLFFPPVPAERLFGKILAGNSVKTQSDTISEPQQLVKKKAVSLTAGDVERIPLSAQCKELFAANIEGAFDEQ